MTLSSVSTVLSTVTSLCAGKEGAYLGRLLKRGTHAFKHPHSLTVVNCTKGKQVMTDGMNLTCRLTSCTVLFARKWVFLKPAIEQKTRTILFKPGYVARRSDPGIASHYHFKSDYYQLTIGIVYCTMLC